MKAALQQWKNMISDVTVNVFSVCILTNVINMAGSKTSPTKSAILLQVATETMICEWNYISGTRGLTNTLFRFCNVKSSPVIFLTAFHDFKVVTKREGKAVTTGVLVCATFIHAVERSRAHLSRQDKGWWQTLISFTLTPTLPAEQDTCRRQGHPCHEGPVCSERVLKGCCTRHMCCAGAK